MAFTQKLTMHLNGGSEFSVLVHDVLKDGKPTGITRQKRTNGSPQYLITLDVFSASDGSEFDVLATKGVGLIAWLEAHTP